MLPPGKSAAAECFRPAQNKTKIKIQECIMKRLQSLIILLAFVATGVFIGCEVNQPVEVAPATIDAGSADFSTIAAIGNSLTAGMQDGYIAGENSVNSYPAMIVRQMGKTVGEDENSDFVFPFFDPGAGSKMELTGFDAKGNPVIQFTDLLSIPRNINYPKPYNNLAVPGALAVDVIQARDQTTSAGNNPLFNLILRNSVLTPPGTELEQAISLNPTFIILWIGNNDVLGAATSGNTTPGLPTSQANFETIMTTIFGGLKQALPNVKGVVANIPDVLSIPFVTTVPYKVDVPGVGEVPLVIQKGDGSIGQATANDHILLTASNVIGDVSGTYGPAGVPVGLDAAAPLPNALALDEAEIQILSDAIDGYNEIIARLAEQNDFALVDANSILEKFSSPEGVEIGGITYSSDYITGGIFSLDGVHPNTLGYSITANAFIEAINVKYGSNIPFLNITEFYAATN